MRAPLIAAALALVACTPSAPAPVSAPELIVPALPQTDAAGARMEERPQLDTEPGALHCSEDRLWCFDGGGPAITLIHMPTTTRTLLPTPEEGAGIWRFIVRIQSDGIETVLVGVTTQTGQMYSGGGGSATHVSLYRVRAGDTEAAPATAAPIPESAHISIRACFDEDDMRNRREACHDDYNFVSALRLDPNVTEGSPRLVLTTLATSFPGARARSINDATTEAPLDERDLIEVVDETCTYTRTFTADAQGVYQPDAPLPNCSDYLEP